MGIRLTSASTGVGVEVGNELGNEKYRVLVVGMHPDNPEITQTNISISIAVQKFIFETRRFPQ